ncbi:MAG: molecular chaperone DnaJ, partial [Candidatus Thioglobus sp.]
YKVLGVEKSSDTKQIKKAYKRLAMKHHPDRNKDDKKKAEKTFKEIQKAYAVLSDEQKRQTYDQFGHAGVNGNAGSNPFAGGGNPFAGANANGFGDIFGDIFGSGRQQANNRGSDLRFDLQINLKEAAEGKTIQIRVPKGEKCNTCDGSGAKPGTSAKTCATCHGVGQVHIQQGPFQVQQPCPHCNGAGKVISSPCNDCHGDGVVRKQKTLSVKIPAGVDDGSRIRVTGEGEAGMRGGQNGDLYVEIRVKPHNIFERHGNDLYCSVPIDFAVAALGGTVEVPTLSGKLKLKIPESTQTGRQFRLKNKGVKALQGHGIGDLICQVQVETPVNLDKNQKELLRQFSDSCGKKQHPVLNSFFGKMKSFFE